MKGEDFCVSIKEISVKKPKTALEVWQTPPAT